MTYVSTPAASSARTASSVGFASRQLSGWRSQQLGSVAGKHPGVPSMLSGQSSTPHAAAASQFGAPSVARITYFLPAYAASFGASARSVAAVGVPPEAGAEVARSKYAPVGPYVPAGVSPRRGVITSTPGPHVSAVGSGNTAAPNVARGPSWRMTSTTTLRTVSHLPASAMLPERSSTK